MLKNEKSMKKRKKYSTFAPLFAKATRFQGSLRAKFVVLNYDRIILPDVGVTAEISTFSPAGKVKEQHAILHVEPRGELFALQYDRLMRAEKALLAMPQCTGSRLLFKRYFLSDATNQTAPAVPSVATSFIQQPPLDGSKVAAWLYLASDMAVEEHDGLFAASHNGYEHLWMLGMTESEGDSAAQTTALLDRYDTALQRCGATLADNCIRTWFYVRDVDTQYAGMVRARREHFEAHGLTKNTHFIASTGIGGSPADTHALVQLGTYALKGFEPAQQRYLYAKTHLNSTYEYGVTFERGTVIDYGDRSHVFISGTASINNRGEVIHVGDIVRQTERMWENVEALLAEAESSFNDVAQIIVYLRDLADYEIVKALFDKRFPDTPCVITLAPVCRPTWLIEMECLAIRPAVKTDFHDF